MTKMDIYNSVEKKGLNLGLFIYMEDRDCDILIEDMKTTIRHQNECLKEMEKIRDFINNKKELFGDENGKN